jgi:hypothetical protein
MLSQSSELGCGHLGGGKVAGCNACFNREGARNHLAPNPGGPGATRNTLVLPRRLKLGRRSSVSRR